MSEDNHSQNKFHQFLLNYIDVLFTLKEKKKPLLFTINPSLLILLKFSYINFFLMNYWAPNFKSPKNDDILTQKRDVIQ